MLLGRWLGNILWVSSMDFSSHRQFIAPNASAAYWLENSIELAHSMHCVSSQPPYMNYTVYYHSYMSRTACDYLSTHTDVLSVVYPMTSNFPSKNSGVDSLQYITVEVSGSESTHRCPLEGSILLL